MARAKPKPKPEVKLEQEVPIPPIMRPGRDLLYPFDIMEVNDSFLAEGMKTAANLYACISRYVKKEGAGKRFTVRKTEEGFRVWRTE